MTGSFLFQRRKKSKRRENDRNDLLQVKKKVKTMHETSKQHNSIRS